MIRIRLIHIIVRATLAVFSPVLRECFEPDEEDQSIVLPDVSTQTLVQIQSLLFGGAHRVNVPSLDLMSALSCLGLNVLTRGRALHKEAKPPRQFICPLCGQYFASIPEVQFHVKESHVITESRGSHDNANSSSTTHTHEIETINHLGTMDEKKFKCLHCDKTFSSKAQFTYHTNIHLGLKPYTCLQCKKSFTQPTHLKIHLRIHDGEKNYMCSVCGKTFSIASNLRKHISIHERDIEEDRRQKSQDKENKKDLVSTSVSENLSTFDSYVGSGSYSCTNEKKLIQHEKNKNGNEHVCSHCNKSFISKSKLTKHVLIHTGESLINAQSARKHSLRNLMSAFTLDQFITRGLRENTSVWIVARAVQVMERFQSTRCCIQMIDLSNALCAPRNLFRNLISKFMKFSIQVKDLFCVWTVVKDFLLSNI